MSSTTFAFAILAGNDLDKIAHTLETIASQEAVAEIHKKIIIAHDNIALTEEWVRQTLSGNDISVVLVPVSLDDTHPQARQSSMLAALSNAMPDDVDWVWTLTDDASLYSKFSLEQVWTHLQAPSHQDVRFVHTCLAPKSYDTGYAQKASVRSLCESHGYFEILGSTSSLVLAKDVFAFFGEHWRNSRAGTECRHSHYPVHPMPTAIRHTGGDERALDRFKARRSGQCKDI